MPWQRVKRGSATRRRAACSGAVHGEGAGAEGKPPARAASPSSRGVSGVAPLAPAATCLLAAGVEGGGGRGGRGGRWVGGGKDGGSGRGCASASGVSAPSCHTGLRSGPARWGNAERRGAAGSGEGTPSRPCAERGDRRAPWARRPFCLAVWCRPSRPRGEAAGSPPSLFGPPRLGETVGFCRSTSSRIVALKDTRCKRKERRGGFGALRCQPVFKLFLGPLPACYELLDFI